MQPRKTFEESCGLLPYQIREKPYNKVRNLTDTTVEGTGAHGINITPGRLLQLGSPIEPVECKPHIPQRL